MNNDRRLLRVSEAAEMAGISRAHAYRLVNEGKWPHIIIPGIKRIVRIPLAELDEWIKNNTQHVANEANHVAYRNSF